MSDAYSLLLLSKSPPVVEDILKSVAEACKLSWEHPDTKSVSAASNLTDITLTKEQLFEIIHRGQGIWFQLWWEGYWSIGCTLRSSPSFHSLTFYFDGVEERNRDTVYAALVQLVNTYAQHIAMLVVDWGGDTAEIDFEDRLVNGLHYDDPFPELLLIGYHFINKEHYPYKKFAISPVNEAIGRVFSISWPEGDS
jgi:hypothetical protein